jgi:type II secretory pathway component GspD/PulD (secretin)
MIKACLVVFIALLDAVNAAPAGQSQAPATSGPDSLALRAGQPVNGPGSIAQQRRRLDSIARQKGQTPPLVSQPAAGAKSALTADSKRMADSMARTGKSSTPSATDAGKSADTLRKATGAPRQMDTAGAKVNLYPLEQIPGPDSIKIPVLDFKNTDIRDILRAIGMQYNVNIFIEPDVTGSLSLYLTDIPVKRAIDFIVKRGSMAYMVENGIVKVYKYTAPPVAPKKPAIAFHLHDGLVDIDAKGAAMRDVAQMFVDSAGINVIVDSKIDKEATCHIKNLKPDKAIKVLCEGNGLEASVSDGIYYIAKPSWGEDKAEASSQLKRLSLTVSKSKLISIEVNNAALDQVIRNIVTQSGINVIVYENITGTVSAKFDSIALDDVLRFLLQNTKYTFWKDKNIYFIGSREMSQQKTTIVIALRHIMADEAEFTKVLPPNISKDAVIKFDKEHNAVIIIGSSDVVAQAQEFIEKIDKPVPQVLIEALVVDFNLNKIKDYGLSLFTQGKKDSSSDWMSERFLPSLDLKPGKERTQRILNNILSGIGVKQILELPENFRSTIHALESANILKVHSTPQIATINGNAATITIGETRYYKLKKETQAPVFNSTSVIGTDERFEVIKFNTELQVTPWVMDEGYVMVKIHPEFNIPQTGGDASTPPNVNTRVIESMVRLRNGQTIVLGGQRQTEDVVNRQGIPILSSIPVLGWLFSSRTVTKNESQMMIFLTPHVYYGDDNAISPNDYFGKEVNQILDEDKKKSKKKHDKQDNHDVQDQSGLPGF